MCSRTAQAGTGHLPSTTASCQLPAASGTAAQLHTTNHTVCSAPLQQTFAPVLDHRTGMTVCKFYSQGNCRFGGEFSTLNYHRVSDLLQIAASLSIQEASETATATLVEALADAPTTTGLVLLAAATVIAPTRTQAEHLEASLSLVHLTSSFLQYTSPDDAPFVCDRTHEISNIDQPAVTARLSLTI